MVKIADKKNMIIALLSVILLIAVIYIIVIQVGNYQAEKEVKEAAEKQQVYVKGAQYGQLLERQQILNSIQQQGYYSMQIFDQNNQSATVLLGVIPQQQAAQP